MLVMLVLLAATTASQAQPSAQPPTQLPMQLPMQPPTQPPTQPAGEAIEIQGMTFVASEGMRNELVLWAEVARVDGNHQVMRMEQVHLTVAAGSDLPAIEIRCEKGHVDLGSNDFVLEGQVRGRTGDGQRFEADWVAYRESEQLLYSDAPVQMFDRQGSYFGGGFRYRLDGRSLRLLDGAYIVREPAL
jgi:LPS export ABC transporter protein LptC